VESRPREGFVLLCDVPYRWGKAEFRLVWVKLSEVSLSFGKDM